MGMLLRRKERKDVAIPQGNSTPTPKENTSSTKEVKPNATTPNTTTNSTQR